MGEGCLGRGFAYSSLRASTWQCLVNPDGQNQSDKESCDFGWLDEMMDKHHVEGIGFCLGKSMRNKSIVIGMKSLNAYSRDKSGECSAV